MGDIDFDELDRAVTSLMQGVKPSSAPEKTEPKENVVSLDAKPVVEPPKADTPVPSTAALVSTQPSDSIQSFSRRGRFMDVVRSGDVKPSPAKPISRQAATITPPTSVIDDIRPPAQVKSDVTSTNAWVPPLTDTNSTSHTDWPDPIDLAEKKPDTVEAASEPEPTPTLNETTTPEPTEPAAESTDDYSPFIPDAKVEKRPLGSTPPTGAVVAAQPEESKELVEANEKAAEAPSTEHLPEELSTDLMAIEAGSATSIVEPQEPDDIGPKTVDDALKQLEQPAYKEPTAENHFAGLVSIPQQYQEEPNSGEKDHVPIYDTSSYHEPLTHPAKKSGGWLWIVWIVGLLLLGAGIAALLYFFHVI